MCFLNISCFIFTIFTILLTATTGKAEECRTPNNEIAQCSPLFSCTVLLHVLPDPSTRAFLHQSNCGGTVLKPLVCCGSDSNFTTEMNNPTPEKFEDLLPISCGFQHSDDYFDPNNITKVTEFPWLALIKYEHKNKTNESPLLHAYRCSGSLINVRYVLTAAQCLTHPRLKPISVRLGEYHTNNNTDCIHSTRYLECSDPVKDFGIEKIISHQDYNAEPHPVNDIGLIRLNGPVLYTDFIRAICLPLQGFKRATIGDILSASGWGKQKLSYNLAITKKRVHTKLITNRECEERYLKGNRTLTLGNQICGTLTENSEIICSGDGGGPVMFSHRLRWVQEGIISFGAIFCDKYPEVYTKVEPYLEWIKENVKP